LNPHSHAYWATNAVIAAVALVGRRRALQQDSIRLFWSSCVVGIPLFALISTVKLDTMDDVGDHRKNLKERLEFSPITRRAWERALKANDEYQDGLKKEIAELEARLGNNNDHHNDQHDDHNHK